MHKILLLAGALLCTFASCKKEVVTVNTPQKPPYRVAGLSDITLNRSPFPVPPSAPQYLNIYFQSGQSQKVTLGVNGLPAGLTPYFDKSTGYPDFYTSFEIKDAGAPSGIYPVQFTMQAAGDSVATTLPFNITVGGDTSCSGYYVNKTYRALGGCGNAQNDYDILISRVAPGNDTLVLQNFLGTGEALKATFDCRNGTFRTRTQRFGNNNYYSATGTLIPPQFNQPDQISINYTEYRPSGGTSNCQLQLFGR